MHSLSYPENYRLIWTLFRYKKATYRKKGKRDRISSMHGCNCLLFFFFWRQIFSWFLRLRSTSLPSTSIYLFQQAAQHPTPSLRAMLLFSLISFIWSSSILVYVYRRSFSAPHFLHDGEEALPPWHLVMFPVQFVYILDISLGGSSQTYLTGPIFFIVLHSREKN